MYSRAHSDLPPSIIVIYYFAHICFSHHLYWPDSGVEHVGPQRLPHVHLALYARVPEVQ